MIEKKEIRLRRARATRVRIALQKTERLTVNRTNVHIYASVISAPRRSSARALRRKPRRSASRVLLSIAPGIDSTDGSRRWQMPRVKPV